MSFAFILSSQMNSLRAVKALHTVVWAFFVVCIVAIPLFTTLSLFGLAALFVGIVALEVAVLVFNSMRCPLSDIAARYTDDKRANFDIYLPEWLARNNKTVFGTLYVAAVTYLLARWLGSR